MPGVPRKAPRRPLGASSDGPSPTPYRRSRGPLNARKPAALDGCHHLLTPNRRPGALAMTPTASALTWARRYIPAADIIKHAPFQVRKALDKGAVRRYREMTRAGSPPPPIRLALVKGVHYLIDGWHRLEAGAVITEPITGGVLADVAVMTEHQARWEAADANSSHGVPLKPGEQRGRFKAFIVSRQHHMARDRLMSYRDIGEALGKPHTTIRNWVERDYPDLFRRMQGEGGSNPTPGAPPSNYMSLDAERLAEAQGAARTLQQVAGMLLTAAARGDLVGILEGTLKALKDGPAPIIVNDF
jgi:hypothetical protein